MNNFTKSSGGAKWRTITNLTSCSPGLRALQRKSMKALMLFMFIAFSSSAMLAQGGGEEISDINGCMHDVPGMKPVSELMAPGYFNGFFQNCIDADAPGTNEEFVIHPVDAINGVDGVWGESTGFAKGSDNCSWTYYYVYIVKCAGVENPFTVKYSGGDGTKPWVPKSNKKLFNELTQDQKGLDRCYEDRPVAPTAEQIRVLYTDNCEHVKAQSDFVKKTERIKNDDCGWIEIHTYYIKDYCDANTVEFSITYSGKDSSAPVFDAAQLDAVKDTTVDCSDIPAPRTLLYRDNCASSGKAKSVDDYTYYDLDNPCSGGHILRTWTAEDDCGNKTSYTQTINILPAPEAYFPQTRNISIPCEDRNSLESYIHDLPYSNHIEGRCNVSGLAKPSYTAVDSDCGSFVVSYTYTDECGKYTINASYTVTIVDDLEPALTTAAKDLTVECDGDGNLEAYNNWIATNGGASAQDNCSENLTWTNNSASAQWIYPCGATGEQTVIFTVTDECGNASKTFATFKIVDTLDPVISAPVQDLNVVCDGDGNVSQFFNWLNTNANSAAKDDCSGVEWTNDFPVKYEKDLKKDESLLDYFNDGCGSTGDVKVVFTVTDDCGNSVDQSATFSIVDSIAPDVTPALDMIVECDGTMFSNPGDVDAAEDPNGGFPAGTNIADFHDWLFDEGGATATDICSGVKWTFNKNITGNACERVITVTWTAADACGNATDTTARFIIRDTNSPAIGQEALDLVVECDDVVDSDANGQFDAFDAWLANNGGATAMDMCDDDLTWTNDWNEKSLTDECGATGRVTITFTVTDDCGLSSSTAAEYRIEDNKAPYLEQLQDVDLKYDEACYADSTPSNTGYPNASDSCGDVDVSFTDVTDKKACITTIVRTWTAEDDCGNKTIKHQTIIIRDNLAPVLNGNVSQFNMSNVNACSAPAGPSEADIAAQFSDACGNVVATLIDTIITSEDECGWARQFVYQVSDNCGNIYDEHVKVSYWGSDQNEPQPTEGAVAKGSSGINDCLENALADNPGADPAKELAKFTDDCTETKHLHSDDLHHITKSEAIITERGCKWAFHYEFTVTDDCGNEYIYKEEYSGEDNLAPRLIDPASLNGLNVSNINVCLPDMYQLEDLISQNIDEAYIASLYMECGPNPGDGVLVSRTATSPVFGDDCDWQVSVEYRVTDACDNDAIPVKVTLSGGDTEKPSWGTSTFFEEFEVRTSEYGGSCPADAFIDVKVGDVINPQVFDGTIGTTNYFINDVAYRIELGLGALDNCTANKDLKMRVVEVTNSGDSCANSMSVTFELEDSCGNVADDRMTCSFIRIDDTNPTASAPADVVVQCADDVPPADTKVITDEADNCNTVTVTHDGDVTDGGFPIENITRSYKVEDACGNFIIVSHNIKVEDTIAPEIECPGDINVDGVAGGPVFVGTFDTSDGPWWTTNPTVYSGKEAAALIFGGAPSDYVISTNADPNNITNSNWASTWGSPCLVVGHDHSVDVGNDGYAIPGGNGSAVSAYVGDWCSDGPHVNYVYRIAEDGAVVDYTAPTSYSDNCDANQDLVVTLEEGLPSGSLFPVGDTVVRYKVVDLSGNDATCTFTVTVNPPAQAPEAPQGAQEPADSVELDFRAYPVPFNKDVNLNYNFKFDTDVTIEVYDTKGLLVKSQVMRGYKAGSDVTLPMTIQGADQLYYVRVITNRGTVTKKIVSSVNKR